MSGMWGIWDYDTYKDIADYEKWEKLFCEDEDIEKQIAAKTFVPLYLHENGIYYPLFQFIHFDASRHSKLKASKVSRGEAKVI